MTQPAKKIKLNFKRAAKQVLEQVAAATMGEQLLPCYGDIPDTDEALALEIKRAEDFMRQQDHFATSNERFDAFRDMQKRDRDISAQIAEINSSRKSRKFLGFGGLTQAAHDALRELEGQQEELRNQHEAHEEAAEKSNKLREQTINRLVLLKEKQRQRAGQTVAAAEESVTAPAPQATDMAVKKISLNFKRVRGAATEAMAEGTLVTGGFDLPQLKQQRAERARREEAEYRRWKEEELILKKQEEVARRERERQIQRMREEDERRRAQLQGQSYGSSQSAPRSGGGVSAGSGW